MKKKYPVKIASLLAAICLLVSVFSMFANAFDEDQGSVRGNFFEVAFGLIDGTNIVYILLVGFLLLGIGFIVACLGMSLRDKGSKIFGICLFVLAAAGATICLFSIPLYSAANGINVDNTGATTLGAGSIVPAVFGYLAALCGAYLVLKKKEA